MSSKKNTSSTDHGYRGDVRRGEIEIVDDTASLGEISDKRLALLESGTITNNELGIVFEDEYIVVKRDPVRFPNGQLGTYLRVVEKSALTGAAGVVMLPLCGDKIYFVRTFRHPTRSWEIELPRGFRPPNATAEEAVKLEISEEIGLDVEEIIDLGFINPNSGILAGTAQAFLVRVADGVPKPDESDQEAIEKVITVNVVKLKEMIAEGEIRDGFTLATVQLAQAKDLI